MDVDERPPQRQKLETQLLEHFDDAAQSSQMTEDEILLYKQYERESLSKKSTMVPKL
jgi:hypothetical protein